MSLPGIDPATLWFLAGHVDRLAIKAVDDLCFKLVQYSEMTGNTWGVTIQYLKFIMVIYVLQQNFGQNLLRRCYLLLFTFKR